MSEIRRLPEEVVNRIAAGEVIERPASVAKELTENALDAGATRIVLHIEGGGKKRLQVQDNGHGMTRDELAIAPLRYATSKLPGDNLSDIRSLGFRGEALAAIGAAGRLTITSRRRGEGDGWTLEVVNGHPGEPKPVAANTGTKVELRDLFSNIPARLKFLRADATEAMRLREVIHSLGLSRPDVAFEIHEAGRRAIQMPAMIGAGREDIGERIAQVLGRHFTDNARAVEARTQDLRIHGLACLPTYRRSNLSQCFFFVNGRPVRDRLLFGALRAAYSDLLPRASAPAAVLFLELGTDLVDVNVHPTKAEVRFRDPASVRAIIVSSVRRMLEGQSGKTSTTLADKLGDRFRSGSRETATPPPFSPSESAGTMTGATGTIAARASPSSSTETITGSRETGTITARASPLSSTGTITAPPFSSPASSPSSSTETTTAPPFLSPSQTNSDTNTLINTHPDARTAHDSRNAGAVNVSEGQEFPLGAALAQIHATYIVSQTDDSLVITDQHAADERLVYEAIKKQIRQNGVRRQILLVPEVVELSQQEAERALAQENELRQCGLVIEPFGGNSVLVREIPSLFARENLTELVRAVADKDPDSLGRDRRHKHTHDDELPQTNKAEERIHQIAATIACHGSIRAGKKLRHDEMNHLLRTMEKTPNSGQCNHGRPSYIELKISALDRLFERGGRKL